MNFKKKNGYYNGKYYIDDKEVYLEPEIKEIFEEAKREEEKLLRRDKRYGLFRFEDYDQEKYNFIDSIADEGSDVEEILINEEKRLAVKQSLSSLDSDELNLIKLLIEKELTEREIAKILNTSHSTINYRKNKIFKKLREILQNLKLLI